MPLHFRHFQTRLLVFLLGPLLLVLTAVYGAVSHTYTNNAYNLITRDLEQSVSNFETAIADRNEILANAGDALSRDFAFKQALDTGDRATILSAMDNLLGRLLVADFIALTNANNDTVIASTLHPQQTEFPAPWSALDALAAALDKQGEYPEAADVLVIDGRPFHTSVLPYFNPELENWVTLGFEIGRDFTYDFKQTVSAEVTVLFQAKTGWQISASTLPAPMQADLLTQFNHKLEGNLNSILTLGGEDYVTLASPISSDGRSVEVLLQRSLLAELQPFEALRMLLLQIFAVGLALALAAVTLVSRTVTRPVRSLAEGVRRIATGDYTQRVQLSTHDEIGELAEAFNGMAVGLAEKEKVRALLGKVVSPEIANELLSKKVELGGEERDVTILFSDVRGFTALCEGQSPRQILSLLNEYFSAITAVIEAQGGVVDKFIGDAVMALFGAPLQQGDAPARAVRAALHMFSALGTLNEAFIVRGLSPISIGVGINSDRVVVGNMGSNTRLNYTAIGDGVNLASRLEGLTKYYGANIIVSEHTCLLAPDFIYLELDKVRVKGKQAPVRIFEPLLPAAETTGQVQEASAVFQQFLSAYYSGAFTQAASLLQQFEAGSLYKPALVKLYRERLQHYASQPPAGWDGVSTFTDK